MKQQHKEFLTELAFLMKRFNVYFCTDSFTSADFVIYAEDPNTGIVEEIAYWDLYNILPEDILEKIKE